MKSQNPFHQSKCLSESQLLQLICGELAGSSRLEAQAHLDDCQSCRSRLTDCRRIWDELGRWEAPQPPGSLASRIMTAALCPAAIERSSWRRFAAALVLAAGVGIAAGLITPPSATPAVAGEVQIQDVVRSLGLDALGSDMGLAEGLIEQTALSSQPEEPR